ncbi:Hsp70 nucleotide exchange factor FES1 [Sporobolomyces koalae]|uniref:Hsp70 nucleotide exchange factor FES1 n=1 Tax=Sporobolomyces koalae TaxID=500713 RepID=UPI0031800D77
MPRAQDPTQSLLRWGIEHAAPGQLAQTAQDVKDGKRPDLSTDVLKQIMGTSDADRMRECLAVIEGKWVDRDGTGEYKPDDQVTAEDKYRAWEDLEMLVQDLDNANDLKSIGGWQPIVKHLSSSEDDEVVMNACWVCGTAVQNNPKSLETFLTYNPLPHLIQILTSTSLTTPTRSKALYCLSSTLKHCEPAVTLFASPPLSGFSILSQLLQDPSQTIRTKTAFLLAQLVSQAAEPIERIEQLRTAGTLDKVLDSLDQDKSVPTDQTGSITEIDADYRDKCLRFFVNLVDRTQAKGLEIREREQLAQIVQGVESSKEWNAEEELGMSSSEWQQFRSSIGL